MELPPSIAAKLVLWWRAGPRKRWWLVAAGMTSAELVDRASQLPSGDTITLPVGEDPNGHQVKLHFDEAAIRDAMAEAVRRVKVELPEIIAKVRQRTLFN